MRGLGRSGGDLGREGQGLGFHGARVSQSRWPVRRRLRCETEVVAATLVGRQSRERRSSQLVLWCARTKTSSLRRRSLVAAKMQTQSQGLELWWWRGEAETEVNGDRGWSCGGVEKERLP